MMSSAIAANLRPQSDLLSNQDAAAYLGVKPRTLEVWRCVKRYPLPFVKIGGLVKYRKDDLDRFIASRRVDGQDLGAQQ